MITATVVIDLGSLKNYQRAIDSDLRRSGNGPIRACFKKWAARYRSFLRERFSRLSRGGGEWPSLALSTLLRRRRGKFKQKKVKDFLRMRAKMKRTGRSSAGRFVSMKNFNSITHSMLMGEFGAKAAILIDTGTLFGALDTVFKGKPGQYEADIDYGIEVGFGGNQLHPSGNTQAKTVEQIASYHQTGGVHLPQRKIVVPPDQSTMDGMASDMETAVKQVLKETGN
jgi:hypothetical protein